MLREAGIQYEELVLNRDYTEGTLDLNLAAAGVAVQSSGIVPVDAYQNTNVPGIFAIGDVTGKFLLTPVAIAAGRRLAERLFDGQPERRLDYENVPSVPFAHPPVGTVGLTEPQARDRYGRAVTVYKTQFPRCAMRWRSTVPAPP